MSNTRVSNTAAIAALDALLAELNTGGAGSIEIRTGAPPATCETPDSGTILATLGLSATAFGSATDGTDKATASSNAITSETSATAGTAAHFRAYNGSAVCIIQGDVTATGGGGDLELDTVTIGAGDTVAIAAGDWDFQLPEV